MIKSVSSPDFHLLRVFVAVTEAGGFSAAQAVLNVGQPTISTQIADLELRLGAKLCRRGRAGFSLTEEGLKVYQAAKELFEGCDKFVAKMRDVHGEISGELRIAIADSLVGNPDFPISEVIKQIRLQAPKVIINLSECNPIEMESQLLNQRLHAAIHSFPNHISGLRYKSLFDEKQTLYCGIGHALFDREEASITVSEVENHDYAGRTYYGGLLRIGTFQPKSVSARCSTMEGLVALILSGQYLGHLPWRRAEKWVEDDKMRPISEDKFSYFTHHECCFVSGVRIVRSVEIFEKIMQAVLPVYKTKVQ
jgi:DNA-binding transcriptional LysR family regulator